MARACVTESVLWVVESRFEHTGQGVRADDGNVGGRGRVVKANVERDEQNEEVGIVGVVEELKHLSGHRKLARPDASRRVQRGRVPAP